jgi:hypothetical protein
VTSSPRRNPCELEIDLLCQGLRIDPSCTFVEDGGRRVARTRAGLGSGLELVLPAPAGDLWVNVPVEEDFAHDSAYRLVRSGPGQYQVVDDRHGHAYRVQLAPEPSWYSRRTSRGTEMARVGVLQGTYLGIYVSNACLYWYQNPPQNCRFCTTGANVGVNEVTTKDVSDVVEVARAARRESQVTFVHFNTGYQGGRGLDQIAPYVKAVKEQVGALIGVQAVPTAELWKYDWLRDLGTDHFSFCYEFHDPETFARLLPGKQATVGQDTFFRALEYASRLLGRGAVSGEIIAGVEPLEQTLQAIDYIASTGAFPTVCIFRPVIGCDLEHHPSPRYEDMRIVMRRVWEACRRNWIPIGAAPNIQVSVIVNPTDCVYLGDGGLRDLVYRAYLAAARLLAGPVFRRRMRPGPVRGKIPPEVPRS